MQYVYDLCSFKTHHDVKGPGAFNPLRSRRRSYPFCQLPVERKVIADVLFVGWLHNLGRPHTSVVEAPDCSPLTRSFASGENDNGAKQPRQTCQTFWFCQRVLSYKLDNGKQLASSYNFFCFLTCRRKGYQDLCKSTRHERVLSPWPPLTAARLLVVDFGG